MFYCHLINGLRFFLSIILTNLRAVLPDHQFNFSFIDRLSQLFGVSLSIWTTIVIHDSYFFTQDEATCDHGKVYLTRTWFLLEIVLFYLTFLSNFFFILFSSLYLKHSGIAFREKDEHR